MKYILMQRQFGSLEEITYPMSREQMLSYIEGFEDDEFNSYYIVSYVSELKDFENATKNEY